MNTKKKILFVAIPYSSHTHSWVELLDGNDSFDGRVFATEGWAQDYFKYRTYSSQHLMSASEELSRIFVKLTLKERIDIVLSCSLLHMFIHRLKIEKNAIFSLASFEYLFKAFISILFKILYFLFTSKISGETLNLLVLSMARKKGVMAAYRKIKSLAGLDIALNIFIALFENHRHAWLIELINNWKPDVIHTLGFEPAGYLYSKEIIDILEHKPFWIHTSRGGPELAWGHLDKMRIESIKSVFSKCDLFIADNHVNYDIAIKLGVSDNKIIYQKSTKSKNLPHNFSIFPGTGGVDIQNLKEFRTIPAEKSRTIVFPKAYECPASKAWPVLEGIKIAWDKIRPCKIVMTAVVPEIFEACKLLPEEIFSSMEFHERIPRNDLFKIIGESRVVLAPSIIDGIPNTLYEAMALGAFPIFSPLDTFAHYFKDGEDIAFARNLYPEEIAAALIKVMKSDELVRNAVNSNYELVSEIADRETIKSNIQSAYLSNKL